MAQHLFGRPLPGWVVPMAPDGVVLQGAHVVLEPLSAEAHAGELYQALSVDDSVWNYMAHGPFHSAAVFHRWVKDAVERPDMIYYALRDLHSGHPRGVAAFMRVQPDMGVIEIGSITFAPALQRTSAATEGLFLMMKWAFDAGYRRVEWKCDALNLPSRRAAQRLGFSYEGVFRQHMVVKGRNRDTAWFACVDSDWPALRAAFEAWLSPRNFDEVGRQSESLSDLTRLVRVASDPGI